MPSFFPRFSGPCPARTRLLSLWTDWGWALLIVLVALCALLSRPLLPADETRYMAVAWEMWRDQQWWVPQLNGETYSHKPPLLFWLIHAGWWLFGINEVWPRLIGPACALASAWLTRPLARRLFPETPQAATLAPWVLTATLYWLGDATMLMFDHPLALFVMLAWLALLQLRDGETQRGIALGALAGGLGLLMKGPMVMIYAMPAALRSLPWPDVPACRRRFAAYLLVACGSAAIVALWAVPAWHEGGAPYALALLRDLGGGRVVNAFDHARPFWWYLPWFFALWLPWSLHPRFWGALRARFTAQDPAARFGLRFCIGVAAFAFVVLSLISGKQPQYLLPLLPLLAILLAWSLAQLPRGLRTAMLAGTGSALLLGTLSLAVVPRVLADFDLRDASARVAQEQTQRPLAFVGVYRGQFTYYGRLARDLPTLHAKDARAWLQAHPDGWLIGELRRRDGSPAARAAVWTAPYRSRYFAAWDAHSLEREPALFAAPDLRP